jgi:hypothetical protein
MLPFVAFPFETDLSDILFGKCLHSTYMVTSLHQVQLPLTFPSRYRDVVKETSNIK